MMQYLSGGDRLNCKEVVLAKIDVSLKNMVYSCEINMLQYMQILRIMNLRNLLCQDEWFCKGLDSTLKIKENMYFKGIRINSFPRETPIFVHKMNVN